MEAMYVGVPIVTTRVGAVEESRNSKTRSRGNAKA
jgi:hypothetical protein